MTDTVYIESGLSDHPRAGELLARFNNARVIECEHYSEVFNPRSQSFRLQKQNPALILAEKRDGFVLQAPEGYGLGSEYNYYFSHMLNCIYDCRYCFLQGMYRSAHWVLFINYEDFTDAIETTLDKHNGKPCWFFSGYDCDSLAYEPVTGFIEYFLPFFQTHSQAQLEIRTKSTQIRPLLKHAPLDNVVAAFSFTPDNISRELEHGVPSVAKRIAAIQSLQEAGWAVGLRFDPLIYRRNYRNEYRDLFKHLFNAVDTGRLHSISLGAFRLPKPFYDNMVKQYPDEPLFAGELSTRDAMVSYSREKEQEMIEYCYSQLRRYVPAEKLYSCSDIF